MCLLGRVLSAREAPPLSGPQGSAGPVPSVSSSQDTAVSSLHPGHPGLSAAPELSRNHPQFLHSSPPEPLKVFAQMSTSQ